MYLVPLRALAVQVADGLREKYEKEGVMIGESHGDYQTPGDELAEYQILVTTYERADSLLRHGAQWLKDVGTLVIDEIQNLSDERRGPRLESVIMRMKRMNSNLQIVALSATVGEPSILADWLECDLVESDERPVHLRCAVVKGKSREESIKELAMTTVQKNGQVLIFHRTRREAETEAARLADRVTRHLTPEEKLELDRQMESIEHWNVNIPPDLRKILHDGVAFHHAGLGGRTRRLVETLFDRGLLRVICATTTLASGMNLPAKTVILTTAMSPANYRNLLSANKVHQMLGRAGRPGRDATGWGIILADSQGEIDELKKLYFDERLSDTTGKVELQPRYEHVRSRMGSSNALTEQLLVALDYYADEDAEKREAGVSLEDIQLDFLGDSYLYHCSTSLQTDRSSQPLRFIELGEIDAISTIERHGSADIIQAARNNALGGVKIRELSNEVVGGIVSIRGSFTCRFSIRFDKEHGTEGPQCSCGNHMDTDGLLCDHLIALVYEAAKLHPDEANLVIPQALGESSPSGLLTRFELIEGAPAGRFKITRLGRAVNRLYLSISTATQLIPLTDVVTDNANLVKMIYNLMTVESGQTPPDSFPHMLGLVLSTNEALYDIARSVKVHVGDMFGLLERTRWMAYSISLVSRIRNMTRLADLTDIMIQRLEQRMEYEEEGDVYDG
jgi:superfamily II DNA/RNA helicase